jgi:hypothetical protein
MMAWLAESFSNESRLTSVGFAYNMAQCLAGGFTPAVATSMVDKVGKTSPGFILTVLSVVSLFGLFVIAPPPRMIEDATSSDDPHVINESPRPAEVGELS